MAHTKFLPVAVATLNLVELLLKYYQRFGKESVYYFNPMFRLQFSCTSSVANLSGYGAPSKRILTGGHSQLRKTLCLL